MNELIKQYTKKEYFLNFWGGDKKKALKELNIKNNILYFDTEKDRKKIIKRLLKYKNLALNTKEGRMTHKRTVAYMDLIYKNKTYSIKYDFGYEYDKESAKFMFFEGNYGCDCNLSHLIQDIEPHFPELNCGCKIDIQNFRIEYEN